MKTKVFLIIGMIIFSLKLFSQINPDTTGIETQSSAIRSEETETNTETLIAKRITRTNEVSSRISFIAGAGVSGIVNKLHDIPVINKTSNNVIIEDAQRIKTSLTVGIVYTPFIYQFTDVNGSRDVAKGFSTALFINPITFNRVTEVQSFFNIIDVGAGFGYKTVGGFLILATVDFFGVKQPRQWFVDEFKDKKLPYLVNGEIQNTIDVNDESIFKNKLVTTFGIKLCYTFDIIKDYRRVNDAD
jgi:hypothetical protein